MTVGVVTDSAAALPAELAAVWGITVVDQHVQRHLGAVTTAAPSPGEFLGAIERSGCDEVVVLTVSARVEPRRGMPLGWPQTNRRSPPM